ncbi:type VI lipase adapter Tla3 domain-containing protein [Collimonas humicola]|uniref:type VI lipase adapter Tla3 domain-containing protein n=1 Tax=Collimonas humicola TaxID=2825886 RepID=UPI001B8A9E0F|nr:DUF2875 family protein [Collimonas humicola]
MTTTNGSPLPASIDSLELVGVGVGVESLGNHTQHPSGNLWQAVKQSNGSYLFSDGLPSYPSGFSRALDASTKRSKIVIHTALRHFMDSYPLPIAVAGPSSCVEDIDTEGEAQRQANARRFVTTAAKEAHSAPGRLANLSLQRGQVLGSYLNDDSDMLWQKIFNSFNQHQDLPAMAVAVDDGVVHRSAALYEQHRDLFEQEIRSAFAPKHARILSDSCTLIALACRGRIDWLRQYAPLVQDAMTISFEGNDATRTQSAFARWKSQPPQSFAPTSFIAQPWTKFQIDQYDHLETMGRVHRPQAVSYLDDDGNPVKAGERKKRMETAVRAALAPVDGRIPARVFYDYDSVRRERTDTERFLPFSQSLRAIDDEFDLHNPERGYDLAAILGDTGAGSPFVAAALATMAGLQSGGATLVANLRRDDGATLLLITPPTVAERQRDAAIRRPFWPRFGFF